MSAGDARKLKEDDPLSFPRRKEGLANSGLPEIRRTQFFRAILEFLHECKVWGRPASVRLIKIHLANRPNESIPREALRWLSTYLAEAPRDVYASEALGRKLLVVQKLEGTLAARRVAREYVERFPSGAYAPTARSLLSNP